GGMYLKAEAFSRQARGLAGCREGNMWNVADITQQAKCVRSQGVKTHCPLVDSSFEIRRPK
ncbi:MAG TPA: hypothetical protein VJX67_26705, partial [Blastocatellia bacterium]|nr:hypothetical protein [Blastocatellia bacterium]